MLLKDLEQWDWHFCPCPKGGSSELTDLLVETLYLFFRVLDFQTNAFQTLETSFIQNADKYICSSSTRDMDPHLKQPFMHVFYLNMHLLVGHKAYLSSSELAENVL